jgi:small-conductance mechanosensitive channel
LLDSQDAISRLRSTAEFGAMDLDFSLAKLDVLFKGFWDALPGILLAAIVFALFYAIARGITWVIRRATEKRGHGRNVGIVIGRLGQGLVLLVGLLVALTVALPTFKPGDVVQFLGIGSVAIGFAFRDILQNFLAGILLLLTHPFRIGDQIIAGSHEGTVEDIQTRATFIQTYDGRRIVIPNATLFTEKVIVNTAFKQRRIEYDIGVGYGDDIERAKELILQAIHSADDVLSDPAPEVLVMELGPSSVSLRARWWIRPPRRADALDARDRVLKAVKRSLMDHGIDLPFPTQQILFHDQTEDADGDRRHQREGWPAAGQSDTPCPRGIARAIQEYAPADGEDIRAPHREGGRQ